MTTTVTVTTPATSANLGPGFDSLGIALALYNTLQLCPSPEDGLQVSGEGAEQLSGQATTVAHEAAHRVFRELEAGVRGVHLVMTNAIPLARGLGSSSAAIVSGLVAANSWCQSTLGRHLPVARLLQLAQELEGHPDNVAPALLGGLVVAAVDGGQARALRVPVPRWPQFVVYMAQTELSTRSARAVLPSTVSLADAVFNLSRASLLVASLSSGQFDVMKTALQDRLHQSQRASLMPGYRELSECAVEAGAWGATLSGAGPCILYWLPPEEGGAARVAQSLARRAAELGLRGEFLPLEESQSGCRLTEVSNSSAP